MQRHDRHGPPLPGDESAPKLDSSDRLSNLGPIFGEIEAPAAKVLICADGPEQRSLQETFVEHGCIPFTANDFPETLRILAAEDIDVVVLEYAAGEASEQLRAVRSAKDCSPATEVVLYHSSEVSISLAEYCQFILAGVRSIVNESTCQTAGELARRIGECAAIKRRTRQREIELDSHDIPGHFGIVGNSPAMRKLFNHLQKASMLSDAPVLITGESGTGKQLLAQAIHNLDEKRCEHPFVVVNCSAITPTLAESELFGHMRGAFTGSTGDRLGYFRAANKGTIFLDEISEMDISLQPKLLRVLQESRVMPVGGETEQEIDVRIIAATNRDIGECIQQGRFRLDLFQRLNVIPINVPPLRSRREDILPLMKHFIAKHAGHYRGIIETIDSRVIDAVAALDSEGNVRQLENLVRHVLLTKEAGTRLELSDLPRNVIRKLLDSPDIAGEEGVAERLYAKITHDGMSLQEVIDYCEKLVIEKVLSQTGHNQTKAAELLKTTSRTIFNKIKKHNFG